MYDHVFNHDENNRAAHPFDEVPEEDTGSRTEKNQLLNTEETHKERT